MHALHELVTQLRADGQHLVLANPSKKVKSQLKRVELWDAIGEDWVFVRTADAVKKCQASVQKQLADAQEKGEMPIKK
jgi:MFS superfamily sulfate permease-like transporter